VGIRTSSLPGARVPVRVLEGSGGSSRRPLRSLSESHGCGFAGRDSVVPTQPEKGTMSLTHPYAPLGRLVAVLAICGSLAACGSSGEAESSPGSSSGSSSSSQSGDEDAGRVRLTQCLRENGVEVPDNPAAGVAAGDIDADELQAALNGPCKQFQDEAFGSISEEDRQEMQDRFQKFAQCMRDNGVDVPDITGGGPPAGGGGIDQDDPDVQAASEKCQDELPQGGPGGGGR
jgi:hypothetical protein